MKKFLGSGFLLLSVMILFLGMAMTAGAATYYYDDYAGWNADALGNFLAEDFEGGTWADPTQFSITADGTPGTDGLGGYGFAPYPTAGSTEHAWWGYLSNDPSDALASTYHQLEFDPSIHAFGAWFDLSSTKYDFPGATGGAHGPGADITVTFTDGTTETYTLIAEAFDGFVFWGFVTDPWLNIDTITLTATGDNPGEHFFMDNVEIAQVPIPAAVWLFGAGLVGVIGVRRKLAKQ